MYLNTGFVTGLSQYRSWDRYITVEVTGQVYLSTAHTEYSDVVFFFMLDASVFFIALVKRHY